MRVYKDGSLDNRSNLSDRHPARQRDSYILKGNGLEVWEPRFTLHGFRYVEVTGFPGKPTRDSLEGRLVHTSADTSNEFACSNKLINQIHNNVRYTLLSSMQSFPQDAADRSERVGWMGDVNIAQDYNVNFNMQGFWRKWLNDLRDSQKSDGELPYVCPPHWRIDYDPYGWGIPVWKGVYPVICWYTYLYYDDDQVMVEHYESMKKWVDYFGGMASNYIVSAGLGDHMEPQPDGTTSGSPRNTPAALTSTAWYYFNTWIVAQAAQLSGKTDEYEQYSKLAEKIKEAFNNEFLDKETNQYAGGSQTSNSVALYLKMVPEDRIDAVVQNIVDDIMNNHNGHLSTGFMGVDAMSWALPEYGAADTMYIVATQTTFPSWGYMIENGATTVWELWDGDPEMRHSFNMKLHCGVAKFFYQGLAGIKLTAPGYKEFKVKPCVVGDLTFANAKIKTVYGPIEVDWKKGDNSFDMTVLVPNNTTAQVSVPKTGLDNVTIKELAAVVWQDGNYIAGNGGIAGADESDDYVTFEVGSGFYSFELTGESKPKPVAKDLLPIERNCEMYEIPARWRL